MGVMQDERLTCIGDLNDPLWEKIANDGKLGCVFVLGQKYTQSICPADTNENILFDMTIPGRLVGDNDALRVTAHFSFGAGSANSKTVKCKIGGFDAFANYNVNSGTALSMLKSKIIANRAAANVNVCSAGWTDFGTNTSVPGITAIDFKNNQSIQITATKAVAGDTIILEYVLIELLRGNQ